jgi:hypothetical protein
MGHRRHERRRGRSRSNPAFDLLRHLIENRQRVG